MNPVVTNSEILELLSRLIRTASENPPGDVSSCAMIVAQMLEKEGIPFRLMESQPGVTNLVANLKGGLGEAGQGKTLLFNGHLDTVPAGDGWSVDPFGAEIKDGYIYGRGATDMKGGLAASLMALIGLKRRGCPFEGEIIFTAVGDEENHSQLGTKWLLARGLTADMAICCEPTNLDICLGNRGLLMVDVVVKGKSSHGGRPNLGKNAVSLAVKIINGLESLDLEGGRNPLFKDPVGSLSVVGIHGGDRINVIPDRCVLYLDRRLMPGEKSEEAIDQIEQAITTATGIVPDKTKDNGSEIVISPEVWHEPFWMDQSQPFVKQCVAVYRRFFGASPVFEGKSAGTDASHLVSLGRIPTIVFGPGDYRQSHTVDEKLELAQLEKAVGFYTGLVETALKPEEG